MTRHLVSPTNIRYDQGWDHLSCSAHNIFNIPTCFFVKIRKQLSIGNNALSASEISSICTHKNIRKHPHLVTPVKCLDVIFKSYLRQERTIRGTRATSALNVAFLYSLSPSPKKALCGGNSLKTLHHSFQINQHPSVWSSESTNDKYSGRDELRWAGRILLQAYILQHWQGRRQTLAVPGLRQIHCTPKGYCFGHHRLRYHRSLKMFGILLPLCFDIVFSCLWISLPLNTYMLIFTTFSFSIAQTIV